MTTGEELAKHVMKLSEAVRIGASKTRKARN